MFFERAAAALSNIRTRSLEVAPLMLHSVTRVTWGGSPAWKTNRCPSHAGGKPNSLVACADTAAGTRTVASAIATNAMIFMPCLPRGLLLPQPLNPGLTDDQALAKEAGTAAVRDRSCCARPAKAAG